MSLTNEDVPVVKAHELEHAFRKANFKVHLIAKEKEVQDIYTIVSPSGEVGQKYLLTFQFSAKPRIAAHAKGWPKDAEENLRRLESAGFLIDKGIPKCDNCGEMGHIRKLCKQEQVKQTYKAPKVK